MIDDRKFAPKALGVIALTADLVTLIQFVVSGNVLNFWSLIWVLSIFFILLLMVVGIYCLVISAPKNTSKKLIGVFGYLYTLLSLAIYCFWSYSHTNYNLDKLSFLGFFVLFSIASLVAILSIRHYSIAHLRFPSYGYASANLLVMLMLVYKYIFKESSFLLPSFAGEIVLIFFGSTLFLTLFKASDVQKQANSAPDMLK